LTGRPQLNLYSFTHPPSTLVQDDRVPVPRPPSDHTIPVPPSSSVADYDEPSQYHSQQPSQPDDSWYHIEGTSHGLQEVFNQERIIHGEPCVQLRWSFKESSSLGGGVPVLYVKPNAHPYTYVCNLL